MLFVFLHQSFLQINTVILLLKARNLLEEGDGK